MTNNPFRFTTLAGSLVLLFAAGSALAAQFYIQCPEDTDGVDTDGDGSVDNDYACIHIVGTDGYNKMADGRRLYTFGFEQVTPSSGTFGDDPPRETTGVPLAGSMQEVQLGANQPGPTIVQREGQRWYLTLSNFPFTPRPDLFDAHTVHYHGFPNANNFYDGVPEMSLAPNPLASLAYFYNLVEPGTYFYHCHVEATEHMQMGMFGNLWVQPKQDLTGCMGSISCPAGSYAYNDGDGSTAYDAEMPLMMVTYDAIFHDASESVQPLDFLGMKDDYLLFNGRGYPDTVKSETQIPNGDTDFVARTNNGAPRTSPPELNDVADVNSDCPTCSAAQKLPSIIDIPPGGTFLVRLSNLSTTDILTLHSPAVPMRVVGTGARELADQGASPNGQDSGLKRHFKTHSVTIGGGRSYDILLDTAGVTPGTYFLYVSNLEFLSNNEQDIGGGMTEIRVN